MSVLERPFGGLAIAIVVLWLLAWLAPLGFLPKPLYAFLFWFGGLLTLALVPAMAILAIIRWSAVKRKSKIKGGSHG